MLIFKFNNAINFNNLYCFLFNLIWVLPSLHSKAHKKLAFGYIIFWGGVPFVWAVKNRPLILILLMMMTNVFVFLPLYESAFSVAHHDINPLDAQYKLFVHNSCDMSNLIFFSLLLIKLYINLFSLIFSAYFNSFYIQIQPKFSDLLKRIDMKSISLKNKNFIFYNLADTVDSVKIFLKVTCHIIKVDKKWTK